MNHNRSILKLAVIVSFTLSALALFTPAGRTQTKVKTSAEEFKNIKVLNSMPADQMGKVMNMMTASLGVDCKFCHVSNDKDYENDDSEHKATAREMLKMVAEINKSFFNGRPEVNCNTCHKGISHPQPVFPLAPGVPVERLKQPEQKPAVDAILDRYSSAVGKGVTAKVESRVIKATRIESDNKTTEPEEILQRGSSMRVDTTYGEVVVSQIFDGKDSWKTAGGPSIDLHPDEREEIRREAQFFGNTDLRSLFSKFEYVRLDRIDGRDVYMVRATSASNQRTTLYFDTVTGMLVRRTSGVPTILGNFVYQMDYWDYKDFGGVKIPTTIKFAVPGIYWTRKITEVKVNAPVTDAKFLK